MNIEAIRKDFPILSDGTVYFDNAATHQRCVQVLDAMRDFSEHYNANPMRGLYKWSVEATERYESARHIVASFIGCRDSELIFVRNATEALNLVAYSYALSTLSEGDEILISVLEHHSNLLPWQMAAKAKGAALKFIEPRPDGVITVDMIEAALSPKTKILALTQLSNVMGTATPLKEAAELIHAKGGILVADGAQGLPHLETDVKAIGCDFYAFSGHKLPGPMGIGGLYGREELLEKMPPFLRGGEMIEYVTRDSATYAELPHKFEAGTVNASGAVGMAAAVEYMKKLDRKELEEHETKLISLIMKETADDPHIKVYGPEDPAEHHGIFTFNIEGVHPHDVAGVLDEDGIAVRAGHHCAQPLMEYMQKECAMEFRATARASVSFYNTEEEAVRFAAALKKIRGYMGYGA